MLQKELKNLETLGPVGVRLRTQLNELYDRLNNKSKSNNKSEVVLMINNYDISYDVMIQLSHNMIATSTGEGQNLTQLAIAIGERVRNYYNLPTKTANSLRLGIFILCGFGVPELVLMKLVNEWGQHSKAKTVYKVYAGMKRGDLRKLVK